MPRWWTRSQQRKYQKERREQASRITNRLLGKRMFDLPNEEFFPMRTSREIEMRNYCWDFNNFVNNPRHNAIITGIEGI